MANSLLAVIISFSYLVGTMGFPRETAIDGQGQPLITSVQPQAPAVTEAAALRCSDGATILHTTDCTMGTSTSYCFKPQPPIKCEAGFFPSVWHPDHCMELSTCFPIDADWIITECSNGAFASSTKTLYNGHLAGGYSTVIRSISCACPSDQWYSMAVIDGGVETFCMPYQSCPPGMTTSISTNQYCATAPAGVCADIATEVSKCECAGALTPIYPDEPGATAIGCE
ncbi:hypothetical protein N7462_003276 [Penicillium macrosclerotiorum]|uniref:uncharacterized protein n=1 Tax=Penicillium macrosclerotiorum TaxID=303699 RepID=UPI0025475F87|nr:uncharacterized protein N7462_003276 [Penicillium macrosclerotiorum]KAJ5688884.1 hypothetical protein N7462_003276 [Penicillium macrosclerotiorum]